MIYDMSKDSLGQSTISAVVIQNDKVLKAHIRHHRLHLSDQIVADAIPGSLLSGLMEKHNGFLQFCFL